MRRLFVFAFAMSLLACNDDTTEKKEETKIEPVTENPLLTDEEKKEGWQLLFDGTSTDGWHNYGGSPVGYAWKVTEGTLHFDR